MLLHGTTAVDWHPSLDFDKLRKDRLAKANEGLHKHGLGWAIVYSWDSKRYLSSVWNHPYGRHMPFAPVLFIRDAGFPYVWVAKGLDDYQVARDCPWLEGRIIAEKHGGSRANYMLPEGVSQDVWKRNAQLIKSLLKEHGVENEPGSIDWAGPNLLFALQNEGLKVVDGNTWMIEARMIKTEEEVDLMKVGATCNEAGYAAVVENARVGMKENELQGIMAEAIYRSGAEYIEGWVINSGPRTRPRSYNWADKVMRPGEMLVVEACHVTFCGYKVCYDRTFVIGDEPTPLQKEVYGVAVDMNEKVQELLRPGITTHDVARLKPTPEPCFRDVGDIRKFRTQWKNHLGGMGIAWYEAPYIDVDEPEIVLKPNMCFSYHIQFWIEDGPNAEGVGLENTFRITENGCENLCRWPYHELRALGV
jgi:Xaa-Pro aminopeptidase